MENEKLVNSLQQISVKKETWEEMRDRIKAPKLPSKKKIKKLKNKIQGAKIYRIPKNKRLKNYSDKTFEEYEFSPKITPIESKGELIIEKVLKFLYINYIREYIFEDLINPKTNHSLRFDFYLPDNKICIEFDGIQHFKPSTKLHGENANKALKDQQYRDKLKNIYCKRNKIKLIRFNYRQYQGLEKIVKAKFVKFC